MAGANRTPAARATGSLCDRSGCCYCRDHCGYCDSTTSPAPRRAERPGRAGAAAAGQAADRPAPVARPGVRPPGRRGLLRRLLGPPVRGRLGGCRPGPGRPRRPRDLQRPGRAGRPGARPRRRRRLGGPASCVPAWPIWGGSSSEVGRGRLAPGRAAGRPSRTSGRPPRAGPATDDQRGAPPRRPGRPRRRRSCWSPPPA